MKENTIWYWDQKNKQHVIIDSAQTIVHPCLGVLLVKDVNDIPKSICNINHAKQDLRKHPICLTKSYHEYILEEIEYREKLIVKEF